MARRRTPAKSGTSKRRDWTRPWIDAGGEFRGIRAAITGKHGHKSSGTHGRTKSNRRSG